MRTTAYTVTIGAHLETELVASVRLPRGEMKLHTLQQHNLVLEETNQAVAITPVTVSPQYLHDDYLKLRVSAIVYSTPLLPPNPSMAGLPQHHPVWGSVHFNRVFQTQAVRQPILQSTIHHQPTGL